MRGHAYLKFGFEEIKNGCGDYTPNATAIDAQNGYQVPISWRLDWFNQ